MSYIVQPLRPAFCQMWRSPIAVAMLGLLFTSIPRVVFSVCNGGATGAYCQSAHGRGSACSTCVGTNCSMECPKTSDYINCVNGGNGSC